MKVEQKNGVNTGSYRNSGRHHRSKAVPPRCHSTCTRECRPSLA